MHDAIRTMLSKYDCRTGDDYVNALREILQELACWAFGAASSLSMPPSVGGLRCASCTVWTATLRISISRFSDRIRSSLLAPMARRCGANSAVSGFGSSSVCRPGIQPTRPLCRQAAGGRPTGHRPGAGRSQSIRARPARPRCLVSGFVPSGHGTDRVFGRRLAYSH
jgi:hypothetical protein